MNHWLDDLSEDWVSQPAGSSSPLNGSLLARSPNGSKSRIPRLDTGSYTSRNRQRSSSNNTVDGVNWGKKILTERSISRENVLPASVESDRAGKIPRRGLSRRSLSAESKQSVSILGTVERKSVSISPPKVRRQDTPEWKKRLLQGGMGYGDRKDLFSPSGLEKIFQKPPTLNHSSEKEGTRGLAFLKSLETIPSSPPAWPSGAESSFTSPRKTAAGTIQNLKSLKEEDGEDRGPKKQSPQSESTGNTQQTAIRISQSLRIAGTPESNQTDMSAFSKDDLSESKALTKTLRATSGQTGASSDFSPVFISKHNTADGRVDYAAIDMSRTQLENHLLAWNGSRTSTQKTSTRRDPTTQSSVNETSISQLQSESLPGDLPVGTPEVECLGDFVNVRRGGLSNDGSFLKRALSPSPLRGGGSFPDEYGSVIDPEPSGIDMDSAPLPTAPTPPSRLRTPSLGSQGGEERSNAATSFSPLKIFGDHDTYTVNKLHRRISQLEDDATDGADVPAGGTEARILHHESSAINPNRSQQQSSSNADYSHEIVGARRFGEGELDEYPFPMETSSDATGPEQQSNDSIISHSPPPDVVPPGAQQPLKFRVESWSSNAPIDTFRGRRKPSKPSARSTLSVGKRSGRAFGVQSVSEQEAPQEPFRVVTEGKRAPSSPFKHPTPKRRRTLVSAETPYDKDEPSMLSVRESSQRMQWALNRKKEGTRYESNSNVADADTLAKRHILRPRNPTPSQRRRQEVEEEVLDATRAFLSSSPQFDRTSERIYPSVVRNSPSDLESARIVAGEVAAFSEQAACGMKDHGRKRSVTTQDFLDEAMKIMSFIRAKGRPISALASLQESEHETCATESPSPPQKDSSPLTISRPPSREGADWRDAWRPRQKQLDPRIIDHLRKYQEENDDGDFSFGRSIPSPEQGVIMEGAVLPEQSVESDPPGVRIISPSTASNRSQHGGSALQHDTCPSGKSDSSNHTDAASRPSTHHSNPSADSSLGRTTCSRKSDNVGTIPPDAVEHLLNGDVAGMTFDKDRGIWVRSPKKEKKYFDPEKLHPEMSGISQSQSEEDPFGNIPDLTVDESHEKIQVRQQSGRSLSLPMPVSEAESKGVAELKIESALPRYVHDPQREENTNHMAATPSTEESPFNRGKTTTQRVESSAPSPIRPLLEVIHDGSLDPAEGEEHQIKTHEGRSAERTPTVTSVNLPTKASSHNETSQQRTASVIRRDFGGESSDKETKAPPSKPHGQVSAWKTPQTLHRAASCDARNRQRFSPSPAFGRQASLVISTPGDNQGRFGIEFTLSDRIHTPVAPESKDKNTQGLVEVSAAPRSSPYKADVTFYLSELADFTVNQVDEREYPERPLTQQIGTAILHRGFQFHPGNLNIEDRFASGNHLLTKALQDEEPNEPFWQNLRQVRLKQRNLTSLHLLDTLCDRLESLDVSSNGIAQLAGIPSSLRTLDISHNCLTRLASWDHLRNLQYLDVSNNDLEDLNSLSNLVHLRELKADGNKISSLQGTVGLDGLLKLSLRGNSLRSIDFSGTRLRRLTHLDLSGNALDRLEGLQCLPEIHELALNDNNFVDFPTDCSKALHELQVLKLDNNQLQAVNLASFAPDLRELHLDGNRLITTCGISELTNLDLLSLRSQTPPTMDSLESLPLGPFPDVNTLLLSNNHFAHFTLQHDLPSLKHLEVACCGIQKLARNLRTTVPNLRTLNLNFNNIRDLAPLHGLRQLRTLHAAANQLTRMRRTVAVAGTLPRLQTLDLRDNYLTHGFYSTVPTAEACAHPNSNKTDEHARHQDPFSLQSRNYPADVRHTARLDDATRLRRRVYELLLASACATLMEVDGMPFQADLTEAENVRGRVMDKLIEMGVVRKVTSTRAKKVSDDEGESGGDGE